MRHMAMRTGLFPAGRDVVGGSGNEFVEGAVAFEAIVFRVNRGRRGCATPAQPAKPAASVKINRVSRGRISMELKILVF